MFLPVDHRYRQSHNLWEKSAILVGKVEILIHSDLRLRTTAVIVE